MQSQWTFLARSMPDLAELFTRLEEVIRMEFLPALLRRDVTHIERDVLSLPARLGGLGITKPNVDCVNSHENSVKLSTPLIRLILRQEKYLDPEDIRMDVFHGRNEIDQETEKLQKLKLEQLLEIAPDSLKAAMKTTVEKGASSWVTTTPLHEHGTVLHKGDFVDAVYLRLGAARASNKLRLRRCLFPSALTRLHARRLSEQFSTTKCAIYLQKSYEKLVT